MIQFPCTQKVHGLETYISDDCCNTCIKTRYVVLAAVDVQGVLRKEKKDIQRTDSRLGLGTFER